MLSLSLVDGRIFFVSEMKFPYKKIFHTQKKCGEILSYYQYYMETKIITASTTAKWIEQIPQLENRLPENCILDKGITGCGATRLAITNDRSTLIAAPTVNLIKNKMQEHADLLGVYGGVTNQEIADYLQTHDCWKIMATYDAIPRVVDVAGTEIYKKAFLLVDEYHRLLFDYSFRHSAIAGLLEQAPRFASKTFLSATPIEQEFLLDELQGIPQVKIIWPHAEPMQIRLWEEASPLAAVVTLCKNAIAQQVDFNLHFFVNSVTFIGKVIRQAKLTPDQVKIVCSTSGESYDRNKEKIDGFPISTPNSQSCKINFYTSTCFEGCDIFDKVGRTYIVSDGTATHSMLDISTTIRQIAGRIRDTQYKEITHIYSKSRYGRDVSYEQFKASTEQETDKAERFLKWYATADEDIKPTIYSDMKFINTETMTLDRNQLKLELLNFRNWKEIYADSRNLITEYKRNGNEITSTDKHDIRIAKLETNGKAKIPFKELFDRYAELRANKGMFSMNGFAADLIVKRNPLVRESYEKLGAERVRELNYNQTQIKRELLKYEKAELAYKVVQRIKNDLPQQTAVPARIIKAKLQQIYNDLGIKQTAKATDLAEWYDINTCYKNINGKNTACIILIRSRLVAKKKIAAE